MAASLENIKKLREMTGAGMMDVKKALDASDNDIDAAVDWLRKNGIAKAAKKADRVAAEGVVIAASNDNRSVVFEVNSETDFVASNERFQEGVKAIETALLNSTDEISSVEEASQLKLEDGRTVEELLTDLTATIGEKITLRRVQARNLDGKNAGAYTHSNKRVAVSIVAEGVDSETLRDIAMHAAAMNPEYVSMDDIDPEAMAKEKEILTEEYSEKMAGKPADILENIINGALNKKFAEVTLLEQQFVKDSSKKVKDLLGGSTISSMDLFNVGEGIEKKIDNLAEEVKKTIEG